MANKELNSSKQSQSSMGLRELIMNHNVCESCVECEEHPSYEVADTGICSKCGSVNEVWDIDLLKLYRGANISNSKVFQALPRLRCSHLPGAKVLSLEAIQEKVACQKLA